MKKLLPVFLILGFAFNNQSANAQSDFSSYSKFDFVPGDKVIFFDDFSQDAIGDFPSQWNTNGKGEVVTNSTNAGKWLMMRNSTTYLPSIASDKFPDNYTIEYDMIAAGEDRTGDFTLELTNLENKNQVPDASDPTSNTGFVVIMTLQMDGSMRFQTKSTINVDGNPEDGGANTDLMDYTVQGNPNAKFHVSITVNKQRLRFYVNQTKVLDVPKALPVSNYNAVILRMWGWVEDHPLDAMISNFRYAEGTTDMRSELMTNGKMVTHGILFDVNSDKIKSESYGTLKEIAQVLTDNPTIRIKIMGYTDSDGDDASNLDLSKRRSAAVKNALIQSFGIDASRIDTDGKGEADPISSNSTPEGKANNRRVEILKL